MPAAARGRGAIGLFDAAKNVFRTEAIYQMPSRELGAEVSAGIGLAGAVLERDGPVVLARYGDLPNVRLPELAENMPGDADDVAGRLERTPTPFAVIQEVARRRADHPALVLMRTAGDDEPTVVTYHELVERTARAVGALRKIGHRAGRGHRNPAADDAGRRGRKPHCRPLAL